MTKTEIEHRINGMAQKLQETRVSAQYANGPVSDALNVVIPMMEDQLQLMRELLKIVPDPYSEARGDGDG